MADNTLLNIGSGGDLIATDDIAGVKVQRVKVGFGVDGTYTDSALTNPLPVQQSALYYPSSTANSTTAQLASGASFTGTVETILSLQAAQIEVISDQPYTISIYQYIDAAGLQLSGTVTFSRAAGVPLLENVTLPGNYFNLKVTNTGFNTTTTFKVDCTFGIMATGPYANTNLGNYPVAISEVGGTKVTGSIPTTVTASVLETNLRNIMEALNTSQSTSSDDKVNQRTLLDVLDPVGEAYVIPSARIVTDNEQPLRQSPDGSGSLMVQQNTRNVGGSLGALGIVFSAPCADMSFISMTVSSANGNSVTVEGYTNSGWQSLYAAFNSGSNSASYTSGSQGAVGVNHILAGLVGCTAVRLRCSNYIGGFTYAQGQLSTSAPFPFMSQAQQLGTWNIGTVTTVTTVSTVTSVTAVAAVTAINTSATANGSTVGTLVSAATNNLTQIKSSAGRLYMLTADNTTATIQYVKLFSLPSASVTMGTTSATQNFMIPASGSLKIPLTDSGLYLGGTGISFAITTGSSLTDNTATTAGAVLVNYSFT